MARTKIFTLETLILGSKRIFLPTFDSILDLHTLLNWTSGELNCLHQLPRGIEQVSEFLLKAPGLSFLADIPDLDHVHNPRQWHQFLDEQIERFEASHDVPQMPKGSYDNWDPIHAQQEMERLDAEQQAAADHASKKQNGVFVDIDSELKKFFGDDASPMDIGKMFGDGDGRHHH